MSGGSLNYVCYKVDDVADAIFSRARTPLHHAFAAHLQKVGMALHDIEWLFSGDYSDGQEEEAIRACLPEGAELEAAIQRARAAHAELTAALEAATAAKA